MNSRLTEFSFLALAAKKASIYVLEQNWFADPLEIKSAQASFDNLIREISDDFTIIDEIEYEILPVVVPKSVSDGTVKNKIGRIHKSRTLSHLPFKAQVAASAILMMIGEEWDKKLGDLNSATKAILGNRIDCIDTGNGPKYRLGSKTTYRFWADDYSKFVSQTSKRFNEVLEGLEGTRRVCLLSTDISQFYPSIDLDVLLLEVLTSENINELERDHIRKFFSAIKRGMGRAGIAGLPQGMISSGFLANIYLHKFDNQVWSEVIAVSGVKNRNPEIHFYSRYVDDIRIVISYYPAKSKPIKSIEKQPLFISLVSIFSRFGLKASKEKTHMLDLDRNGAKLTEGLLAEHMEDLAKKSYGALIPSKSESLGRQFELLFCIDSTAERKPPTQIVQRNKYNPVIDGPGVRPDSRKRFAAGRFRRLYETYKDVSGELVEIKNRFLSEMFREWKSDPSQIRLLFYAFELSEYSDVLIRDAITFLKEYGDDKVNFGVETWIPFIEAAIIRTFIDRTQQSNSCPQIIIKLAQTSISFKSPWYLRALSWQLLACYKLNVPSEINRKVLSMEPQVRRAYNFWRFILNPIKIDRDLVRNSLNVAKSIPISRIILDQVISSLLKHVDDDQLAEQLVIDNVKEVIRIPNLVIKGPRARKLAVRLGAVIKTSNKSLKKNAGSIARLKDKSLLTLILEEKYKDPLKCVEIFLKIVRSIRFQFSELEILAVKGKINPFNFYVSATGAISYKSQLSLSGWASADWRAITWLSPEYIGKNWGWPLGMLMRLCLTANRSLIYGAPPSHRYNLYFNQSRLCRENGFASESLVRILAKLFSWPGTLIRPYQNFDELETDLQNVLDELIELDGSDSIRLLTGPTPFSSNNVSSKIRLLTCQIFNGLNKDQMLTDAIRSRKMVLFALDEAEQRIQTTASLNIQDGDPAASVIVAFPEMAVPQEAFGDIFRFVKKNNVMVLFGAWPLKDLKGAYRNSLFWIFPGQDPSGRIDVQALKQDKIYPINVETKKLGIIPASPKIIWRIPIRNNCRVAAINCYELTNIGIKSLLSGRIELLNVPAFNEDVSLFDGQAKSYSYDSFGFVSIINSGLKGGSCVYAPYKGGEHAKQKVHLHGENQFLVPILEIDTDDFRLMQGEGIKTPPAGFRIKK